MNVVTKFAELVCETWKGKSLARILSNWRIAEACRGLTGVVIDLGSGSRPSHERSLPTVSVKFTRVDLDVAKRPDIVADINRPLPFPDRHADHVLLFSVVYILEDPLRVCEEVYRILKPGGFFYLTSPLMLPEAREPHDFRRLTSEGLDKLLRDSGFRRVTLRAIGERFSSAAYVLTPFIPRLFRIPVFALALLLDRCIPKRLRQSHPAPLGYFVTAEK